MNELLEIEKDRYCGDTNTIGKTCAKVKVHYIAKKLKLSQFVAKLAHFPRCSASFLLSIEN